MTPSLNHSDNLFVANLQSVSLEKLVKSKLEVLFQQQKEAQVELNGLYNIVLEQVEKPLIELALAVAQWQPSEDRTNARHKSQHAKKENRQL